MNLPKAGASEDISADNSQFDMTNRSAEEIGGLNTKAKTYAVPFSQTQENNESIKPGKKKVSRVKPISVLG